MTAEIQVRTLMEEVWGEVDHTMNYPYPVESLACREQLKVLARVTSSASRLVDSIFATVADHNLARGGTNEPTVAARRSRRG
jgi:ppGpp synthetase/RelA/SpoT-type nucleotidyltranferase